MEEKKRKRKEKKMTTQQRQEMDFLQDKETNVMTLWK